MVIIGFTVVGKIDMPEGPEGQSPISLLDVVAILLVVPAWFFFIRSLFRQSRVRRAATEGVPNELADPPSHLDPAVVSTVVGKGTPTSQAVAATVLGLALQSEIDIQEHGDRVRHHRSPASGGREPDRRDRARRTAGPGVGR